MHAMIGALCTLGLAIAMPASAQSEAWTLTRAENGSFSMQTPCTAAEIAAFASEATDAFESLHFVAGSQVVCQKGPLLIVAGVVETGELPGGVTTYFDKLASGMPKGNGMSGKPEVTTFVGRRAIVNRAQKDGAVAQTLVLELSPKRIIMLVGGFNNSDLGTVAQGQTLDRFFASFKVTGQ